MSSQLAPLETKRLYRQIADALRDQIDQGHYPVGSLLPPERELAGLLHVSRTSVREALVALEVEGRVAVKVGHGVTVLPVATPSSPVVDVPSPHGPAPAIAETWLDVGPIEVLDARLLIEPETAALAAAQATADDLAALRDAFDGLPRGGQQAAAHEPPQHWAEDRRFHEQIARCSGNPVYERLVTLLWIQRASPLYRRFDEIFTDQAMIDASHGEHEQIYRAIVSRDAEWSRLCMRRHLDRVRATYMRSI
ncbi:MAG TPA: FadR/GntR family transcriptional regulator [Burkholderiaceae bacterium]|nr:FadR/GntR family transcriptional regulator [Burkholderiaceae bacterium]